jgi:tRNA A-37 threonylcarbamoyl transferase component Bud32
MGAVWAAEQSEPVKRRVALKLIKAGMDSSQVLRRFEAERQALALMEHPNIAKVLDAGATPQGRPYFAMELIKGIPITKFSDQEHLTPRERLELFIPVCQAVQHAHQKGIIHRDLKPSNVLIALYDGKPVPKVIDFGVAKATSQRLTEQTMYTEVGQIVGTLEYMAPEQAELNNLDIDTRADIYSLGVILYELLAGSAPFTGKQLRGAAFSEMLRLIREVEPPKPSTRLSSSDELPSIAANRKLEPNRLTRMVHGDLDWIVMKALEKDRGRRYETANGFGMDIQRYLDDEPVLAGRPSAGYRLRKFVRRNKGPVLAAALILLALLGGISGTTWGLLEARKQRDAAAEARDAEAEQRVVAEANEQKALSAAQAEKDAKDEAQAVLKFVEDRVFAAARPETQEGGLGYKVTLRKAIESALPFVASSFSNQPLVEARLRMTLGKSFYFLGDARTAAEQEEAARALYARHRGLDHTETLMSMHNLASSYDALGRLDDALKLREETLALRKAKLGPDHPDTLASMNNLALSYGAVGRNVEAVKLREETLTLFKAKRGADHPDTLMAMNNLANGYFALGRNADALKLREETFVLYKAKLGPDHPDTLRSMGNLASSYGMAGRYAEALKLREETLALRKAKLGPDHPSTLISMSALGDSYESLGRHADARKIREETLALRKAKLGVDHPDTLQSMSNLGDTYYALDRYAEALKLREETLALRKAKLGPDHPDTLTSMRDLAESYHALGQHAEALKLREQTLALRKAKLGPDQSETLISMGELAESLIAVQRAPEALAILEECVHLSTGHDTDPKLLPWAISLRFRCFEKTKDAAGCRQTATMWEALKRVDAVSLYNAACFRSATAAVIRAADQTPAGSKQAEAEADRAMAWLKQTIAAGYKDAAHIAKDKDLDALRSREDFKKLLADLESKAKAEKH